MGLVALEAQRQNKQWSEREEQRTGKALGRCSQHGVIGWQQLKSVLAAAASAGVGRKKCVCVSESS